VAIKIWISTYILQQLLYAHISILLMMLLILFPIIFPTNFLSSSKTVFATSFLGYTTKYSEFLKWVNADLHFTPPGTSIKTFTRGEDNKLEEYIVTVLKVIYRFIRCVRQMKSLRIIIWIFKQCLCYLLMGLLLYIWTRIGFTIWCIKWWTVMMRKLMCYRDMLQPMSFGIINPNAILVLVSSWYYQYIRNKDWGRIYWL